MSILLFLAVLFVLILVHELGHFAVAKWTGMRVDEFGIGFPPRLFGVRRGETLYSLNALPIGGFVKIFGEDFEAEQSTAVPDTSRAFTRKGKWAQAAVLVAGVVMNILFAWALYATVFMMGVPTIVEEGAASDEAVLTVASILPESPAAAAGIPAGAEIAAISADGETLAPLTPSALVAFVAEHAEDDIAFSYRVGEEERSTTLAPVGGILEDDGARPVIGIEPALVETVRYPLHVALYEAAFASARVLTAIVIGVVSLIVDAVTLDADLSSVAGPVGIVGMVGDAADFGIAALLLFTALISLNLAVINLLPVPALDGGRLLFVAIEAVLRRPLDPVWAGRANVIGFAILILLMVVVTFNDILRLV